MNEKITILIFFCSGLFINLGTVYIVTIGTIYKYDDLQKYIKNDKDFLENKIDNLLAFLAGVIIQQIYIPFFILSIIIGFFLNTEKKEYIIEDFFKKFYTKYIKNKLI